MLVSLQTGIQALSSKINACFVVLGDQPTIQASTINAVMDEYRQGGFLVIPSYAMRRGHPWLIDRQLWPSILDLSTDHTMRDFLNLNQSSIHYVNLNTDSILKDLDTPQDYHDLAPKE
jgi:molybdenum cofactor cytidylyltransferase